MLSWGLGAMCQWQMFSTNRSEAKMRECKAYSNPAFEKLTDKYVDMIDKAIDEKTKEILTV